MKDENGNDIVDSGIEDLLDGYTPTGVKDVEEEIPEISLEIPLEVPEISETSEVPNKEEEVKLDIGLQEHSEDPTPPTVEPEKEKELSDIEVLKEQNRLLIAKYDEMLSGLLEKKGVEKSTEKVEDKIDEVDFVGDEDIDYIVSDKVSFNKVLNKLRSEVLKDIRNEVSTYVPKVVAPEIAQQIEVDKTINNFYSENQDLVPFKKAVGYIANELFAKDPTIQLGDLLVKAAEETRKSFGLHLATNKNVKEKPVEQKPAFVKQTKTDRSKPAAPSGIAADVLDLIS